MTPYEIQKKTEQEQTARENMALLSKRRLEALQRSIADQKRLREMLEKYYPWGKPGGGAPNINTRLTDIRKGELIPDEEKRMRFGKSPLVTPRCSFHRHHHTHRHARVKVKQDSESTKTIRQQQEHYRRQLDSIVAEQKKARKVLERERREYAKQMEQNGTPWGKVGPGGHPWRPPPAIGSNFFKSLGWTNEGTLKEIKKENFLTKERYQSKHLPRHLPKIEKSYEPGDKKQIANKCGGGEDENKDDATRQSTSELTGGVELVPLLAKRRTASIRVPLSTTDVTRPPESPQKPWINNGNEYLTALSNQVKQKHMRLIEVQQKELESAQVHFDTWQKFWGRPGHGAPRSDNHHKKRLSELLYTTPLKIKTDL